MGSFKKDTGRTVSDMCRACVKHVFVSDTCPTRTRPSLMRVCASLMRVRASEAPYCLSQIIYSSITWTKDMSVECSGVLKCLLCGPSKDLIQGRSLNLCIHANKKIHASCM